jgi:hypothetical protein
MLPDSGALGDGGGAQGDGGGAPRDGALPTVGCLAYPRAQFCDDFENFTATSNQWGLGYGEAPKVVQTSDALSGSYVLRATDSLTDAGLRQSQFVHQLPRLLSTQSIVAGFSLRINSFTGTPRLAAGILLQPMRSSGGGVGVQLQTKDAANLKVLLYGSSLGSLAIANVEVDVPFTVGKWIRFRAEANFVQSSSNGQRVDGTATAYINDVAVATKQFNNVYSYADETYTGAMALTVGGLIGSTSVDFDDAWTEQR